MLHRVRKDYCDICEHEMTEVHVLTVPSLDGVVNEVVWMECGHVLIVENSVMRQTYKFGELER